MAGGASSGCRPTHWQPEQPPLHPSPSPAAAAAVAAVTKPCDDLPRELPRYRTDFVTYCSATRYFHLPLHTASLQQALDAATSQAESATLPRFNRDTRDTGCKRERTKEGGGGDTCRRIVRDTVSPAYCPAATTLPCRSAREEKVTHQDQPPKELDYLIRKTGTANEFAVLENGDLGNSCCVLAKCLGEGRGCPVTGEVGRSIKSPLMPLTYQKVPS